MKIQTLVLAAVATVAATAVAAEPGPNPRPFRMSEIVSYMESICHGEVTAIQLDASGDKPPHYHVDIWYPDSGLARVDVDAASREMFAHDTGRLAPGSATLAEVATLMAAQLPGHLTIVELDTGDGAAPHYDVDARLGDGKIARLKVDAATRSIGWREPAVVDE